MTLIPEIRYRVGGDREAVHTNEARDGMLLFQNPFLSSLFWH